MRVLYVTGAELGRPYAPASRAKGLTAGLARRGIHVHLIGTEPAPPAFLPQGTVEVLRLPRIRKIGALVWHADLALRLADLLSERFDVVLMRETPLTLEPAAFARLRRIPFVLEVNGIAPEGRHHGLRRSFYDRNYRAASRIVVLTPALGEYLSNSFGVDPSRLALIPNAADARRFYPRSKSEARRHLGFPQEGFLVVYMGSYHSQQGVECVVPLCEALQERIRGLLFVMTGAGVECDALRERVRREGLERFFRFVGALPDDQVSACVSAADAAFSPIRPEEAWRTEATFPQKVVEYLACGIPVLAMGSSGTQREMLESSGCGRLISAENGFVARLAGVLEEWHSRQDERALMGARAVDLIRSKYSYDAIAERFEELFRSL